MTDNESQPDTLVATDRQTWFSFSSGVFHDFTHVTPSLMMNVHPVGVIQNPSGIEC
jgi:hypothetical protein